MALVRRYEGHDQEVYAKLIFKSAATILREIGFAFFPPLDRDTSNSNPVPSSFHQLKDSQQLLNQDFCVWPAQTLEFHFQGEKWFLIFVEK